MAGQKRDARLNTIDPAIHVFASRERKQDVDHRDKPGDDS
jgi:hypothetical protein